MALKETQRGINSENKFLDKKMELTLLIQPEEKSLPHLAI
jgi:hypothetical protein